MNDGWNPLLLKRIDGIRKMLIAQYEGGSSMTTPDKGKEREIFVSGFLGKLFTDAYRFGEGRITDSKKDASGQIDVIVEAPLAPSFPMVDGGPRLYLADSVALTIEVKSDFRNDIDDIKEATKEVKKLTRNNVFPSAMVSEDSPDPLIKWMPQIPYYVFSYEGHKDFMTLVKTWEGWNAEERPDGIYVLRSGCFVSNRFKSAEGNHSIMLFLTEITAHLNNCMNIGYPNLLLYSQGYIADVKELDGD